MLCFVTRHPPPFISRPPTSFTFKRLAPGAISIKATFVPTSLAATLFPLHLHYFHNNEPAFSNRACQSRLFRRSRGLHINRVGFHSTQDRCNSRSGGERGSQMNPPAVGLCSERPDRSGRNPPTFGKRRADAPFSRRLQENGGKFGEVKRF